VTSSCLSGRVKLSVIETLRLLSRNRACPIPRACAAMALMPLAPRLHEATRG
jgi:hypothetical protein